jgi:hypothetical protein
VKCSYCVSTTAHGSSVCLFVCLLTTLCPLSRLCDVEIRKGRMFVKSESGSGVF